MGEKIRLSEGSGGREMHALVSEIMERLKAESGWRNLDEDGANLGDLVFTTDAYIVTPIFFPGGDIGKLAFCGTVNDLAVMGAKPLGMSLSLVLEEGMPKDDLFNIIETIRDLSARYEVPVVTGDTKVTERGKVDKIIITTTGIGRAEKVLDAPPEQGDRIVVSGGIGEHGAALLATRFDMETSLTTDSKPLWEEMNAVGNQIRQAKDVTRGGLAAVLNEMAEKSGVRFEIDEGMVPVKKEVDSLCNILGIDAYSLACEGRLVCIAPAGNADNIVEELKRFNSSAAVIGEVRRGEGVVLNTKIGKRVLSVPSGVLVPRIC